VCCRTDIARQINVNPGMPSAPHTPSSVKKAPKKRLLSVAVFDGFSAHEMPLCLEASVLNGATRHADSLDFPEGQEDPAQSAELERQQDA